MIYLDHNATTPLAPEVREAMLPFLGDLFGNPSSVHSVGRRARVALDDARERVARVWRSKPSEIIFTSGGTESNSLAILGSAMKMRSRGNHVVTSAIEHRAVLGPIQKLEKECDFLSTKVCTDPYGLVDPQDVADAIQSKTVLVSIMAANNEIGTIQAIAAIAEICRQKGVLLHIDAVQWVGKESLTVLCGAGADLVSCCGHKIFGPKGVGMLYARSPLKLDPLISGGSQEDGQRAGTENLVAIAGFARALEMFVDPPAFTRKGIEPLTARLEQRVTALPGVRRWGPSIDRRLSNTLSVSVDGCDSLSLLAGLDLEGICASSGSACSAGALEPSHVLQALGADARQASSLIRFSLGPDTTGADIDATTGAFERVVERVRNSE